MFLSIAILDSFILVLSGVLTISVLGLGLVVYNQFIHPVISRKESDRFIPVQTGDK
ncbi:hypothetical protein [Leptospira wolbachii]|nr:hypothetical protein [Leptospira wolbachii]